MLESAHVSTSTTVGEHCSFPQAHSVAMLLYHGSYVEIDEHSLCGQ